VLGDVGEPEPVGPVHGEAAVHEVVRQRVSRVAAGAAAAAAGAAAAAAADTGQAGLAHEPLHALAATRDAQPEAQLGVDPGAAIDR